MNQHLNDSAQRWANSCVGLGDLKVEVKKEEDGELTTGMRSVTLIMPSDDRYPENMAQERDMAVQICKNLNLNLIKQEVKADEVRCLLPAMKSEVSVCPFFCFVILKTLKIFILKLVFQFKLI